MRSVATVFWLGLALAACGDKDQTAGDGGAGDGGTGDGGAGDGGAATDCHFEACGGDPVGTWTVAGTCFEVEGNPFADFCADPDLRYSMTGDASGTIDFGADQQYSFDVLLRLDHEFFLPAACLTGLGSCDYFDDPGEKGGMDCEGVVAEGCSCTWSMSSRDQGGGTWSVAGTTLRLESDSGEVEELDFCAQGSRVTLGGALDKSGYFSYELTR